MNQQIIKILKVKRMNKNKIFRLNKKQIKLDKGINPKNPNQIVYLKKEKNLQNILTQGTSQYKLK